MKSSSSRSHQPAYSRSYVPERSRRLSSLRSDDASSSSSLPAKRSRKMKCVIIIGITLPVLAAVIGITAWALCAEAAFPVPSASSLRRIDTNGDFQDSDILQSIHDRRDSDYTSDFHSQHHHRLNDMSRVDELLENNHKNDFSNENQNQQKDPLYIVHFVPSPQPKEESSTSEPHLGSTVSSDVLKKIMSASKGVKPGTPQFVVFAPVPEEQDLKNEPNDVSSNAGNPKLSFFSNSHQPAHENKEIDYDYEEELRKYEENLKGNTPTEDVSRASDSNKITTQLSQLHSQGYKKESVQVEAKNFTSGAHSGRQSNYVEPQVKYANQQSQNAAIQKLLEAHQLTMPQLGNYQQSSRESQQSLVREGYQQQVAPQSYQQQVAPQSYQQQLVPQSHQQDYQQRQPHDYQQSASQYIVPQADRQQAASQYIAPQADGQQSASQYIVPQADRQQAASQYIAPQADRQQPVYSHYPQHPHQQQISATDRSGYEQQPVGIKLNFGGSPKSPGGYSPLGIIASILGPILPKPRINLNGKMMFGVMLENGIKFGDQHKGHVQQYHQGRK